MKIKIIGAIIAFIILSNQLLPEILHKISGRAVYNGVGIKDIEIKCNEVNHELYKKISTNHEGNFHLYVPNGEYVLNISKQNIYGYISSEPSKFITVDGKNVSNIIFFLEKECIVSGIVTFEDSTPIKDASIQVVNNRSLSMTNSDSKGKFSVSGLRASDNTMVKATIPGVELQIIENLVLTEGSIIENVNFFIPKNLSISGKVLDKETKEIIKDPFMIISDGNNRILVAVNDDGGFFVYNLEKKEYTIMVYHPDYDFNLKSVVYSGEPKNIEIELRKNK
jgi:hypothetical protein